MPDPPDPIELLRISNPADEAELEDPNSPEARRILARILAQPRRPVGTLGLRWRRLLILTAGGALVTAAALVLLRPVIEPMGLTCYSAPVLEADRVAVASGTGLETVACDPLWADLTLTNPAIVPSGVVPELRACVSPSGGLAVFPTTDAQICKRLGLLPPDPASLPEAELVRRMTEILARRIGDICLNMDQAAMVVEQVLGDSEWKTGRSQQCRLLPSDAAPALLWMQPTGR